ncbi:YjbH domain-containing protein [Dyella flava]|uniref:YjbH domain-containing protein n=1 Tax=Dyella flava TaxID=1920170 RepID=A0ABS2K088_9GAMM|nr:YjbH domain-containing protein [Dyella flava]
MPLTGLLFAGLAHADIAPTESDWGGTGLLQTPSAQMAQEGELGIEVTHVSPYTRYNFTLQPLPWLEGIFRYTDIDNRAYGPAVLSGDQTYKDKSIDIKVRVWRESHYLPDVAIGIRDVGGTGLFSSEYVVGSKRFGPIEASLGMAWGYMGSRGDIDNPLSIFSSRFNTRPLCGDAVGGQFCSDDYFRGPAALFGGFSYQTPWDPLTLKIEYEGNNYQHEPLGEKLKQDTPVNVGAVFRLNRNVDFSVGFERGNTAMLGITLHTNIAQATPPPKLLDPPPPPRPTTPPQQPPEQVNWADVSRELQNNAGLKVSKIARSGSELIVTGEQTKYLYIAQGIGRAARVLDNHVGPGIDWYTVESTNESLPVVDTSINRHIFDDLLDHQIDLDDFQRSVEQDAPQPRQEEVLYQATPKAFDGGLSLTYAQSMGGPNAFILYQIAANYDAEYHFAPDLWWSGTVSANLVNNYDKFTYTAPSDLPRVRTDIRQYLTSSDITMPNFQLTTAHQLADGLYGMAYAGMLESMFGGVGGETLYRPFGERWALGADINWVKQRGFDQGFTFRDYHIVTGQATLYVDTGVQDVTVAVSAGRYLAGDWGGTIDISREFRNGVRMGAYATLTNVDGRQYGEGSFDKGIYISIPFDLMLPESTVERAGFLWEPLVRDGGARLQKRYSLYTLTDDLDSDNFDDNLQKITY